MPHRPEWWPGTEGNRTLLDMALDLHMDNTGSGPIDSFVRAECFKCVQWAVENWRTDIHDRPFDNAVLALLKETLAECRAATVGGAKGTAR